MKSLRAWSSSAPHAIRSGVPSRASIVSLPVSPKNASSPVPPISVSSPAPPASTSSASPPCSVSFPAPPAASTGWVTWLVVTALSSPPPRSIEMLGAIGQLDGRGAPPLHGARAGASPPPSRLMTYSFCVWVIVMSSATSGVSPVIVTPASVPLTASAEDDRGRAGQRDGAGRRFGTGDQQPLDRLVAGLPEVDAGRPDPLVLRLRAGRDDLVQPGLAAPCRNRRRRRASRDPWRPRRARADRRRRRA